MISLNELNKEQRKAAETIEGPVLILAGAGSGKTRTITYRISHMISNLGIPPRSILGVSFTNKAAGEMRERMAKLLGNETTSQITLSTFHSLGVRILKRDIDKIGYSRNFSIYDTSDQMAIVKDALKHFNADKNFDRKRVLSKIGFLKNQGISENDFADSPHFDPDNSYDHATEYTYRVYQEKLKFFNAIDFDDILFLCVKLFRENPDVAEKYSRFFKYIMIDEYQDTNSLQLQMVLALTSTHKNICVVGDDDQAIYSFRGANIENILNFEKKFSGAKIIKLEENYRSTAPILTLANKIIKENKKRSDKTLRAQKDSKIIPLLLATGNTDHEAQMIVEKIAKDHANGTKLSDIAVLYRGKNQAPPIEDQLILSAIPYTIIGGQKFYDKKEVKDLMAYLFLIVNLNDEISLRRILNVPNRGIGMTTLGKFLKKASDQNLSLFKTIEIHPDLAGPRSDKIKSFTALIKKYKRLFTSSNSNISQTIDSLIEEIGYMQFIEKQYQDNLKQADLKKQDVSNFINSAERFSSYHKKDASLTSFVNDLLLRDSQDREEKSENENKDHDELTLMTLHSSKGLEYDTIYLAGAEEEFIPHKKTIQEGENIDEERRLMYVGVTRAREKLVMTYCKERKLFGKTVKRFMSRFLNDHKDKGIFIEQDCTIFEHLAENEVKDYKKNFFSNLMDSLD